MFVLSFDGVFLEKPRKVTTFISKAAPICKLFNVNSI